MANATTAVPQPVAGSQSSEFRWMGAVSIALGAAATQHLVPPEFAAAVIAALSALYSAGRQTLKAVHAFGYLKNVKDLPEQPK